MWRQGSIRSTTASPVIHSPAPVLTAPSSRPLRVGCSAICPRNEDNQSLPIYPSDGAAIVRHEQSETLFHREKILNRLLVVFSHGKESGPYGSKILALSAVAKRVGAQTVSVDYREHPPGVMHDQNLSGEADRRSAQLLATRLPEHEKLFLWGPAWALTCQQWQANS